MQSSAEISNCGKYRYKLQRRWAKGSACTFVMLNPSVADASIDDPTIRRCISFAKREGCGSLTVVNLFAFRATDPKGLPKDDTRYGPLNSFHLSDAIKNANGPVIAAWGTLGGEAGKSLASMHANRLLCLGRTRDGSPRHPLYVRSDAPLTTLDPLPVVSRHWIYEMFADILG